MEKETLQEEAERKKREANYEEEIKIKVCPKCGQEMVKKLIGDEFYDLCEDCGLAEGGVIFPSKTE